MITFFSYIKKKAKMLYFLVFFTEIISAVKNCIDNINEDNALWLYGLEPYMSHMTVIEWKTVTTII